ncbi:TetR/AcrR family transcriptional regulator, partial [Clostridium botulinum]|nr:TetR/AcrR family transcriptional regulator [Clostridium botulinum]
MLKEVTFSVNDGDKVSVKKQLKEKQLFDSAYELFLTQGIEKTSISDIVNKAGIA